MAAARAAAAAAVKAAAVAAVVAATAPEPRQSLNTVHLSTPRAEVPPRAALLFTRFDAAILRPVNDRPTDAGLQHLATLAARTPEVRTPAERQLIAAVEALRALPSELQRGIKIVNYVDPRMYESFITRQHNRFASWQRAANSGERLASHQHRLAHGDSPEALEVAWQAPRQSALAADHAIEADGCDQHKGSGNAEGDRHGLSAHTATGALISGCGS
jgi:hypothetical protein